MRWVDVRGGGEGGRMGKEAEEEQGVGRVGRCWMHPTFRLAPFPELLL